VRRVTIHDVAAAAGVSKSTVSRILNKDDAPEDNVTARAVRSAADRLGYVRDFSAVNLRLGRTGTVGVVVTNLIDVVRAMFLDELDKVCRATGRFVIAAGVDGQPDSARQAVELLLRKGVDELILTTTIEGDRLPEELTARGIPFVLALRSDGTSPSAVGDDARGGYLATQHLLELGHRRIALISGPAGTSTVQGRITGYRKAMTEAGLAVPCDYVVAATFGAAAGREAAAQLLSLRERPTAIFAVNDTTAIGALSALTRRGFRVPHDMSLVGYSDIPIVRDLPVPLTTIRVPYDRIAADAVALLDQAGKGLAARQRVSEPVLVVRESSGPLLE
jgi:LacI family transcriptional regulator